MAAKKPNLHRHTTGVWFTKWNGRFYYFGKDQVASEKQFLDPKGKHPGALINWMSWRAQKREDSGAKSNQFTIAHLIKEFLSQYHNDGRRHTEIYYRASLRRFAATYGQISVHEFDIEALHAFRDALTNIVRNGAGNPVPIKPRTMRHDLNAIKTMWRWGYSRGKCPALMLNTVRAKRVPRSHPEDISIDAIKKTIAELPPRFAFLGPYLALNYLCLLRPSEVMRIALGQARLMDIPPMHGNPGIPNGQLRLTEHKTAQVVDEDRIVLISEEALEYLPHIKPLPRQRPGRRIHPIDVLGELNVYGRVCRQAGCPGVAHRLRDSAASHLLALGEDRAAVDLLLGHAPTGELQTYGREALALLHRSASRLTLR